MAREFDEEEQKPRADKAKTKAHKGRGGEMDDLLGAREHHQQGGGDQDKTCDHLALQLGIAEDEALRQQGSKEAHHHHGKEELGRDRREQDAHGEHDEL